MSIKINNKLIAGKYKTDIVQPANEEKAGIIRIATEEEVLKELDNTVAVTPAKLSTKQNKLTAGENISIEEDIISATYTAGEGIDITNGVISNTQTSAEWGNIKGDINTQEDLQQSLNTKVDKEDGKSLISNTEIERLANVDNYDDTAIKDDISSINTDIVSINNDLDSLEDQLTLKQNLLVAGENITLTPEGDSTRIDAIIPTISTDDTTIIKDDNNIITAIGTKSKNNIISYDWMGTVEEYNNDLASGLITNTTKCFITDDETELTHLIEVNTPTKLSELANDTNFINKATLDNVKDNLQQQIDAGFDDSNLVHKTGSETIEGFKKFKEKVVVENDSNKGRIAHKNTSSSLEDGYIEFGENTLVYGKQNIQGEAYDEKKNIFHEGNLVAGDNIIITKSNGIYTIVKDDQEVITTVGVKSKSDIILYDWVGTSEEYKKAVEDGIIESNWICYITDDDKEYESPVVHVSDTALLDIIISNHLLEGKEKIGKELQGSLIYKYAYPDAYDKLLNNKNKNSSTLVTESISGISVIYTQCSNSWKILDIANKSVYDELFNTTGSANFFVLDEVNELFYLPKTNNIYQPTTDLNKGNTYIEAGLPNINHTHTWSGTTSSNGAHTHTVTYGSRNGAGTDNPYTDFSRTGSTSTTSSNGAHTHTISGTTSNNTEVNSIYGNSNTVQPQTNNVFVYYKVGDIVSVDASINVNEILEHRATTSLDNLTTEGEKHFLNKQQITNCLLEVPQRIKYDLTDGTLTIKAGSIYYIPDGFESDGVTRKFNEVVLTEDKSFTNTNTSDFSALILFNSDGTLRRSTFVNENSMHGGSVAPTLTQYMWWYDTANNLMKTTSDTGATWTAGYSLPILKASFVQGVLTSIEEDYTTCGYIGSTVWVNKGVKGLIPNGRNEDGTLKNIEFTLPNILVSSLTGSTRDMVAIIYNGGTSYTLYRGFYKDYKYNAEANVNMNLQTHPKWNMLPIARTEGDITSFQPKQPIQVLDYGNKNEISGWSMPSDKYIDLTLGVTNTKYTAPTNGWFAVAKTASASSQYLNIYNITSQGEYIMATGLNSVASGQVTRLCAPCKAGKQIAISFNMAGSSTYDYFRFIYAEGEI